MWVDLKETLSPLFLKDVTLKIELFMRIKPRVLAATKARATWAAFFTLKVCRTMNHKRLYGTVIIRTADGF